MTQENTLVIQKTIQGDEFNIIIITFLHYRYYYYYIHYHRDLPGVSEV